MQLDARIGSDPAKAASRATRLEADGFDGVWMAELVHNPFLGLAVPPTARSGWRWARASRWRSPAVP